MKIFMISIVMWWADPMTIPWPGNDAVEIQTQYGKQLYFETLEDCYNHVDDNLDHLIRFGHMYYPTADAVGKIICVEKEMYYEHS